MHFFNRIFNGPDLRVAGGLKFIRSVRNSSVGLLAIATLCTANLSLADDALACRKFYVAETEPSVLRDALKQKSDVLCFKEFSIFHSGITKTSLWTAQHLTAASVEAASAVDREDVFHAEPRLAAANRAELEDYRRSGYDRGHMAPAADMASVRAQDESFSLANMVPQLPELNRGLWSRIEATTRNLARQYGEVYVVTGPAFIGKSLNRLNGRLIVPSHTYKAVYLPGSQQAGVWWAENKGKGSDFEVISVKELSSRIGVDVFPGVPDEVKSIAVQLPAPKAYSNRNTVAKPVRASDHAARTATSPESKEPGWADYGIAIIQHLLK